MHKLLRNNYYYIVALYTWPRKAVIIITIGRGEKHKTPICVANNLFIFLEDVCHNYQNLTGADRRYDKKTVDYKCDNNLIGWYRFQGTAGTKMVTTCPEFDTCGGSYPAWLMEDHPTVTQGSVQKKVCIRKSDQPKDCCEDFTLIYVKNCGSYYIYKLFPPGPCNARYCSTD